MANSVTFPKEYGGSGITITDDADPKTGLDGTGYTERFVPALSQTVAIAGHAVQKAGDAKRSASDAIEAAQQASADRDSINLDMAVLNELVVDAGDSATTAADSAATAVNMADAVAQATATYASISAGIAGTVDTEYFRVIEAPEASKISVYQNDADSATLIATYYTQAGVDAKAAAGVRLNRSLQRLGDQCQTLHADFAYGAYGEGSGLSTGVDNPLLGEELLAVQRATPKWVFGPSGALREVPTDTLARQWDPITKKPLGVLIERSATNLLSDTQLSGVRFNPEPGVTVTHNEPDPFGGNRAIRISFSTAKGVADLDNIGVISGTLTTQCWAKVNSGDGGTTRLKNRSSNSSPVFTGDWAHYVYTEDASSNTRYFGVQADPIIPADVTICFPQVEAGEHPTSYIPTSGERVTRAEDIVSRTLGKEAHTKQGTWVIRFKNNLPPIESKSTYLFFLKDNDLGDSSGKALTIQSRNRSSELRVFWTPQFFSSGLTESLLLQSGKLSGVVAISYEMGNVIKCCANGEPVMVNDKSPPDFQASHFFFTPYDLKNINYESIIYIPSLLSDDEIRGWTS